MSGRRTGLRTSIVCVVDDYAKALEHVKDDKDVVAAVEKVCKRLARAGATVPGCTITTEEKAV